MTPLVNICFARVGSWRKLQNHIKYSNLTVNYQIQTEFERRNMALSKPIPENVLEKLSSTKCKDMIISIPEDEIKMFCWYTQPKAVSIHLIKHFLGGENMNYEAVNLEDSFQCFEYSVRHIMELLKQTKDDILFFEHRKCKESDVFVVVTRQPKAKGIREHLVLKAVVRMTIMTHPRVGFCRYLNLTGN